MAYSGQADLLARSQRLEAQLNTTTDHLRSLQEQLSSSESLASFGHFKIDHQDRFVLSRTAAQLLGVAAHSAFLDEAFFHTSAQDRERLSAAIRLLAETGQQADCEIALAMPLLGTRWLRIVVRNTQATATADLYGLIIDTTEAKRDAVRRDIALQVSEALLQDVDSQDAYEWVLEKVCTGLDWDLGSCWVKDAAEAGAGTGTAAGPAPRLRCLAVWTRPDPALESLALTMRGREVAEDEGMVGAVFRSRTASWAEQVGADEHFAERALASSVGIRTAYTFPIVVEDAQCVGVLQFLSRRPRQFDAQLPALSGLIGALLAQRMRRERWIARLREVAERDALTGLLTRYALMEFLWTLAGDTAAEPFSICVFDLNRFKLINDGLGHEAGDLVLKTVAERVRNQVGDGVRLARLGGDEFAAVVAGGDAESERAMDAINKAVALPLYVNGYEFSLMASSGAACFPRDGQEPESLLREADARRRRHKRMSRGVAPSGAMPTRENPLSDIQTEHELRHALDHGELVIHYQPIMRLGERKVVGAEALIRWNHPRRGMLLPGTFLGVAEQSGLTRAISRMVLGQVTRDLAGATDAFGATFRVNVNLSALDFRDLKLFTELGALLREAGMTPQRYRFEVTESMLMEDVDTAERVVGLLADFGVEFAIDDFGTGYSSLAQLARLPVHELKIDPSFTQSIETKRGKAVVRAVLDLAARLEMPVTAEGIESRTQALTLAAYGCEKGQGYLFARAMPFAQLLAFMRAPPGIAVAS